MLSLTRVHGASGVAVNAVLATALFFAIVASVSCGAVSIPALHLLSAVLGRGSLTEVEHAIVFSIRLPRVLASGVVGAALAVSGLLFQGLFRNPMADPYIIGASGGAGLGACIGVIFLGEYALFGISATALLAFAGAVLAMAIVYAIARTQGRTSGITLLLAGFAVGTILSNSIYLFELADPNSASGTRIVAAWLRGVIGVPQPLQLGFTAVLLAVGLLLAYPLLRRLNTLALGDEYAHQLGLPVEQTRIGVILVGSLLTAVAVSLGGLISFVGLIVPHVMRLLFGPEHVRLLGCTALAGALFLVVADTLARTMFAPTEVPVGIFMVFIGGPFFLYLLRRYRRDLAV